MNVKGILPVVKNEPFGEILDSYQCSSYQCSSYWSVLSNLEAIIKSDGDRLDTSFCFIGFDS